MFHWYEIKTKLPNTVSKGTVEPFFDKCIYTVWKTIVSLYERYLNFLTINSQYQTRNFIYQDFYQTFVLLIIFYSVTFLLYFALKLICAGLLMRIDLSFKLPASNICGNIGKIFKNIECVLLIIAVFVSGKFMFCYMRLDDCQMLW